MNDHREERRSERLTLLAILIYTALVLLLAGIGQAGAEPLLQESPTPTETPTGMPTETPIPTITPTPTPDILIYSTLEPGGQAVAVRMEITAGDMALAFLGLAQLTVIVIVVVIALVRERS